MNKTRTGDRPSNGEPAGPHFWTAPGFEAERIVHGFGTCFLTLDRLRRRPGLTAYEPVALRQVHSDIVHVIDQPPPAELEGDALVTRRAGLLLIVRTADCLPILIFDAALGVIAAVHAGWRGTRLIVAAKAVRAMKDRFGSRCPSLRAALGPAICSDCYEVGEDVRQAFESIEGGREFFRPAPGSGGKYLFDLRQANRVQLIGAGIPAASIFDVEGCTLGHPVLLSHRGDRGQTGRLLNFIGLRS